MFHFELLNEQLEKGEESLLMIMIHYCKLFIDLIDVLYVTFVVIVLMFVYR